MASATAISILGLRASILAITSEGDKEVLGLWIEQTEGAKFWLKVMNELQARGLHDILIAVVDGLTGFLDAIGTVFPLTAVQTCIVGLLRKRGFKCLRETRALWVAKVRRFCTVRRDLDVPRRNWHQGGQGTRAILRQGLQRAA